MLKFVSLFKTEFRKRIEAYLFKKIYVTKTLNSYIYDGKNINGHNLLINVINKLPLTYLNGSFYKQVKMLKKIVTVHQVY